MNGALRVRLSTVDGQTQVSESYAHAPFHYLPPRMLAGEPPLLTIVNSSGGVVGGDQLEMRVDLDAGAMLTLRTQSATRLYRSPRGGARAVCRFHLGDRTLLDYFPDEIIPFAGSDYEQLTSVELGSGAAALLVETVTAGRLASDERFAFTRLALDLRCTDNGTLVLRDRADIRPGTHHPALPGVLGDATVWGAFYVMTTEPLDPDIVERVDAALRSTLDGHGGASALPCGLIGRVVGLSVDPVRDSLRNAHATVLKYVSERIVS